MRPPSFWNFKHGRDAAIFIRSLVLPIAFLYNYFTQRRIKNTIPFDCKIPVISIGNITLGGTGKTPIAEVFRAYLNQNYGKTAIVSRGYGGSNIETLRIKNQDVKITGDEPLMLAQTGEVYIAHNRVNAAKLAIEHGVKAIILDDGHQNPSLLKTLSIIVIDGSVVFGNGFIFPSGPLREKPVTALKRADAIIWVGDKSNSKELETDLPIYFANIKAIQKEYNGKYLAFCGIGNPSKFNNTIKELGIDLIDLIPFPDHHFYTKQEINDLKKYASSEGAKLLTTEKDYVRLSEEDKKIIETVKITIEFEDNNALQTILSKIK